MGVRRRPWLVVLTVVIVVAIVGGAFALFASRNDNSHGGSSADAPAALTVNGNVAPVGVDPDHLAFAWHVVDARQNAVQTAYRLLVSTKADPSPGSSGVVWDDAVRSGRQAFVAYAGPKLAPDTQYWWTVQTTTIVRAANTSANPDTKVSSFSSAQPFVTGLRDTDWKAQWVRPGPAKPGAEEYTYVRKDARLESSPIVRATAYVAAAHQYQLFIDGKKVAAGPSFSYPDASYYEATDVTHALRAGAENAVGVLALLVRTGSGPTGICARTARADRRHPRQR